MEGEIVIALDMSNFQRRMPPPQYRTGIYIYVYVHMHKHANNKIIILPNYMKAFPELYIYNNVKNYRLSDEDRK